MREDVDLLLTLAEDGRGRGRRRRAARHGRLVARARGAAPERSAASASTCSTRRIPQAIRDARRRGSTSSARSSSRRRSRASTLETRSHTDYFWKLAPRGAQWVAITDPGLGARAARARSAGSARSSRASRRSAAATRRSRRSGWCRRRCSASTCGGCSSARCEMADACRLGDGNPGLELGLSLGEGWEDGRDKVCVAATRRLRPLGRAAHRGVDRQGGQGPRARARRVARRHRPAGAGGAARVAVRARPGVLPLGVRRRRRRLDPRHQPVRPAGRAGGEGQDERGARRPATSSSAPRARSTSCSPRRGRATTSASRRSSTRRRRPSAALAALAERARSATGCVVTHGFGPRYLHSTGQLHKGGPNTGVFVQVVDDYGRGAADPGPAVRLRAG